MIGPRKQRCDVGNGRPRTRIADALILLALAAAPQRPRHPRVAARAPAPHRRMAPNVLRISYRPLSPPLNAWPFGRRRVRNRPREGSLRKVNTSHVVSAL